MTTEHEGKSFEVEGYILKFVYSEKATEFCESTVHTDKSKVEISQNFGAFSSSEYVYELYLLSLVHI